MPDQLPRSLARRWILEAILQVFDAELADGCYGLADGAGAPVSVCRPASALSLALIAILLSSASNPPVTAAMPGTLDPESSRGSNPGVEDLRGRHRARFGRWAGPLRPSGRPREPSVRVAPWAVLRAVREVCMMGSCACLGALGRGRGVAPWYRVVRAAERRPSGRSRAALCACLCVCSCSCAAIGPCIDR